MAGGLLIGARFPGQVTQRQGPGEKIKFLFLFRYVPHLLLGMVCCDLGQNMYTRMSLL